MLEQSTPEEHGQNPLSNNGEAQQSEQKSQLKPLVTDNKDKKEESKSSVAQERPKTPPKPKTTSALNQNHFKQSIAPEKKIPGRLKLDAGFVSRLESVTGRVGEWSNLIKNKKPSSINEQLKQKSTALSISLNTPLTPGVMPPPEPTAEQLLEAVRTVASKNLETKPEVSSNNLIQPKKLKNSFITPGFHDELKARLESIIPAG